jgi:arylformamidase
MPEIIDLSHPIDMNMPVYPGTEPPIITEVCSVKTHSFKESQITFFTHTGTHLDVPAHLFQKGKTVDAFEGDKFFGTALLIDYSNKLSIDFKTVHEAYSRAESPDFIIFNTGWNKWWGDKKYFKSFPVLTPEAAEYISSLPIKGLGIDSISFDPVGDINLSNHKIFMEKNIILVENLCSLEKLKGKPFQFSCLPLNIVGADGSPTRAFAILK